MPTPIDTSTTVFFFQLSGNHRHLHSFPTRRSSDLSSHRAAARPWCTTSCRARCATPTRISTTWCCSGATRSEEHTSELQSRLHLVCRLLLEKKKRKRNIRKRRAQQDKSLRNTCKRR